MRNDTQNIARIAKHVDYGCLRRKIELKKIAGFNTEFFIFAQAKLWNKREQGI